MRINSPKTAGLALVTGLAVASGLAAPAAAYTAHPALPTSAEITAVTSFAGAVASDWNSPDAVTAVDTVQRYLTEKTMTDLADTDQQYFLLTFAKAPEAAWDKNCAKYSPEDKPCIAVEKKLAVGWAALETNAQQEVKRWAGDALPAALDRLSADKQAEKIKKAKAEAARKNAEAEKKAKAEAARKKAEAEKKAKEEAEKKDTQTTDKSGSSDSMPVALGVVLAVLAAAAAAVAANPALIPAIPGLPR